MFYGDPKILGKRGAEARQRNLTPVRRTEIAAKASYARWYKVTGEDLDRINSHLRGLALIAAKAQADGDDDKYIRTVTAMGQYERMRIMLTQSRAKDAKPADITEIDDSVKESVKAFRRGRDEEVVDVTEEKEKK